MQCYRYASECKRGCTTECAAKDSYQPANGTEGMDWMEDFCFQCLHENPYLHDGEHQWFGNRSCEIMSRAMCFKPTDPDYPKEWIYQAGKPVCTKFQKWDWGNDGDPDDPDNPKKPPEPPDPDQLDLFPLHPTEQDFEEKKIKEPIYEANT